MELVGYLRLLHIICNCGWFRQARKSSPLRRRRPSFMSMISINLYCSTVVDEVNTGYQDGWRNQGCKEGWPGTSMQLYLVLDTPADGTKQYCQEDFAKQCSGAARTTWQHG
ncbi:uncharacterized protein LOC112164818 isoform X1 [Rosa chinensis]|uniref:uncharacterized protein LOC112164818 isoform X1 n=1 Tax=Rosa chinensis TaxID=74649 RepID=UPI001AD8C4F3|nr:uncharacterized protein LOC112164818 isoform X1 [Rosa chinensis]